MSDELKSRIFFVVATLAALSGTWLVITGAGGVVINGLAALAVAMFGGLMTFVVCPSWLRSWRKDDGPKPDVFEMYCIFLICGAAGIVLMYMGEQMWRPAWLIAGWFTGIIVLIDIAKRRVPKQPSSSD